MIRMGDWLSQGWEFFSRNMGTFVLATLLAGLGAMFSCSLLAGPLTFGLCYLSLEAVKGLPVQTGEIARGFDWFGPAFLWWLAYVGITVVLSVIGLLGPAVNVITVIISILITPYETILFTFAAFQIVDARVDLVTAFQSAFAMIKKNYFMFWIFGLVFSLLEWIGALVCCVGILFTGPWIMCAFASAYRDLYTPSWGVTIEEHTPPEAP